MTSKILIVKLSSFGDLVQAFFVLPYLKAQFPHAQIDWVVDRRFASLVSAHPLIGKAIVLDIREVKSQWRKKTFWQRQKRFFQDLRRSRYDFLFDLQGNCKSGLVTFFAKSRHKIGFGKSCVRERPNVWATQVHVEVDTSQNIRFQYASLVREALQLQLCHVDPPRSPCSEQSFCYALSQRDRLKLEEILSAEELQGREKVMVCPGSNWVNKQLPLETWTAFLQRVEKALNCSFLLMWGREEERVFCSKIQEGLPSNSKIVEKLALPVWQNLMDRVRIVIAVDSGALHLCATTSTPSFSLFGPTLPEIFKPIGPQHAAMRGTCPYHKAFEKQCPLLRSCPTGACIRNLQAEELFTRFMEHVQSLKANQNQ